MPAPVCGLQKFRWVHTPIRYKGDAYLLRKVRKWMATLKQEEKRLKQ